MYRLIIFVIVLTPLITKSQDWSLFKLDQANYYLQVKESNMYIEAFVMDSTILVDDVEIQYFNNKSGLSDDCYKSARDIYYQMKYYHNPDKIDSLVIKEDSVLYISEYASVFDTFIFKPTCKVGDSWTTKNQSITISCSELITDTILGIIDSIRIFNFSPAPYNTIQFILSKSHGLIQFIPFREFIYHNSLYDLAPYFKLIGFKNTDITRGYVQPEFKDYFHLHAGDILYWRHYNDPGTTHYSVDSITNSLISNDSVTYDFFRKSYDENGNFKITTNYSSVIVRKDVDPFLRTIPHWFGVESHGDRYRTVFFTKSMYLDILENDTITYYEHEKPGVFLDTVLCDIQVVADYDQTSRYSTREGLVFNASYSWGESSYTLMGSIIDGVKFGITDIPTSIEQADKTNFKIYPNPITNTAIIQISSITLLTELTFTLYNSQGKEIINENITLSQSNTFIFNRNGLSSGLYFYSIKDKKSIIGTGKIVLQ